MSTTLQSPPAPKTSALRRWFPLFAVALAVLSLAVLWRLPEGTPERLIRSMVNFAVVSATLLAVFVWLLFFAPFHRGQRLRAAAALALLLGAFVGSVQLRFLAVDFDGDLVPTFRIRHGFPLLALGIGALAVAVSWLVPQGPAAGTHRMLASAGTVGLAGLAFLGWQLFFAPVREPLTEGGNLAVASYLSGNGPTDWPEFRGRKRDGVVTGPALATDWSTLKPLWRHKVGAGHSSFAVAGNLDVPLPVIGASTVGLIGSPLGLGPVFAAAALIPGRAIAVTLEQRDDREAVVCYHVPTGQQVWAYSYPARFSELMGGPGPRSTPTIQGGEVYSLGATGKLVCLEARTGKEKWTADILENNANLKWGMSGSPLVLDDVVVVNPGAQTAQAAGTLAAYDRKTGKRLWSSGRASAGYSSPMLATLAGKVQILLLDGEGISGYDPADKGKELWRYPWPVQENINVSQPVLLGDDRVLVSSGYDIGSAALQVKQDEGKWTVKRVWQNRKMRCKFSSPVLYQGHLYGLDEGFGFLVCLDANTGERKWRGERYGHGQLLLTNGQLLITSEQGELALVKATPDGYQGLTRLQAISGRTWNLPALANGLALVRNHLEMACYDLKANPK
jgi:outer membrane protein assembly factor BamB